MPVPPARPWQQGEKPMPADANLFWRDALTFLLGDTSPAFMAIGTAAVNFTSVAFPLNTEIYKRGGMVHAVNAAAVTVPIAGTYRGTFHLGMDQTGLTPNYSVMIKILINGTEVIGGADINATDNTAFDQGTKFSAHLAAGDNLSCIATGNWSANWVKSVIAAPRSLVFETWYASAA